MSSPNCCGGALASDVAGNSGDSSLWQRSEELRRSGRTMPDGTAEYVLNVPDIHCGGCISAIERGLSRVEGVAAARVNLTLRRVTVKLDSRERDPGFLLTALERLGYPATPLDMASGGPEKRSAQSAMLLRALAVSGFAAGNIMLLSVSVWSGAEGATRDLFHLLSATLAVPAIGYAGQPFFRSAWSALRVGRLNMDVPISLAVLLALGMSLFETFVGGQETYFDAAVTLLFFLLVGRYLDQMMRERARSAVTGIARLASKGALAVNEAGELRYLALDEVEPGMRLRVAAGERFPVDGRIVAGTSDVDRSLVTGESEPMQAGPGATIEAGALNLTGAVDIEAVRVAGESFLAEVMRMMEAAERGRGHYVSIADRMARLYAPTVHLLAAAAFAVWLAVSGDWHVALQIAIAVLIITCPCALGLAVPVVHVIGAARLFERGILMRDGSAIERLSEIDTVVLDKTGTLTSGVPAVELPKLEPGEASKMLALASRSVHPASRAVARALSRTLSQAGVCGATDVREVPGHGVEGSFDSVRARLGRSSWVAEIAGGGRGEDGLAFAVAGMPMRHILLHETLRKDAAETVAGLQHTGVRVEILSGDSAPAVSAIANELGVADWRAGETPKGKIRRLENLREAGRRALMVGDGINDAPALAASHVSMAPASASDAGRQAADLVFTRDSLSAVTYAREIALRADRLVKQNFGLAIAYNCIAAPAAFAGYVTPLFAAIAMSASSIVVISNSMRLGFAEKRASDRTAARPVVGDVAHGVRA